MANTPPSTPQPLNPSSMRFPYDLTGKVEPEVAQAHEFHFNAAVDLNNAISTLSGKIQALQAAAKPATTTAAAAVPAQSTPPSSNLPSSGLGAVNIQTASTYLLSGSDYAGLVGLNGTTTVELNSGVNVPYFAFLYNLGGSAATLIPTSGDVNGVGSVGLGNGQIAIVFFDGTNWVAMTPLLAEAITKVTHQWLDSYDDTTGLFTQSQPTAADVTNAADVTAHNTFTPLQSFTNGLQIGTAPAVASLAWQFGIFLIEAVIGGTVPMAIAFEAFSTYAVSGVQASTAEVAWVLDTTVASTTYQGFSLVESTPANFLSPSNTVEFQFAAAKAAAPNTVPPVGMAVGDVDIALKLPVVFQSTATLAADPASALEAATKQYVDAVTASGVSGSVSLAALTVGGTTGSLTVVDGIITAIVNPT